MGIGNEIRSYLPVYRQTWGYAVERGELEEYSESRKLDKKCREAIEETILQNYDGMHLHMNRDSIKSLAEQYGLERMAFILANTIRQASWDGRFSRDNKSWASKFSIDEDIVNGTDRNRYLTIGVHPTVLDGFINMFRREIPELEKENRRDVRSMQAASISSVPGYVVMSQFDRSGQIAGEGVYLGKSENYSQDAGIYDNSDNSLVFVSDNPKMFGFLDAGKGWTSSQQEMIDKGMFTAADYAEYDRIMREILSAYPDVQIKHFSIDIDHEGSGIPFSTDWQPKKQRSIMRRDWDVELEQPEQPEAELAFRIADRYISIQETEGGYDYSIMDANYKLVDGGVYDNPDVTIREALEDIVGDLKYSLDNDGIKGNMKEGDDLMAIDYDELMEKAEEANRIKPAHMQSGVVENFRAKTNGQFHRISEMSPAEIEETVKCYVQGKLEEHGIEAEIVDAAMEGSRCRGLERKGSDLDVVVEISTQEREDALFDMLNEEGLYIGGVKVDINPITAQKTGTLETYLPQVEEYLARMREAAEKKTKSIFSITMYGEQRFFENTSGLDAEALCKAYEQCEKPFVDMGQYGNWISEPDYAWIQQGDKLLFSLDFNVDRDEIVISDGEHFERKGLRETLSPRGAETVPPEKLKDFVKEYYERYFYDDLVCTKKMAEALSVSIRKMIDTHQMVDTRGAIEAVLDKDITYEFIKSRQPNTSPVPAEVIQAVGEYFETASGLGSYTPIKICRISNDPSDHYLYATVGYNLKTEEYACWTSWNNSTASLNMGHYNLPDERAALDIIRDRFNDIADEPSKYGMDRTLASIKQPEMDNLRQPEQKQDQAGKIVHFSGKRGR